jgi:outer membrane protein assembly factor BamB
LRLRLLDTPLCGRSKSIRSALFDLALLFAELNVIARPIAVCAAGLICSLFASVSTAGEDWPRFRGVNGTGVSDSHGLPVEIGAHKNLVWKIAASKGSSSPIIAGGQLYFSSYEGKERTLHCLDPATGKTRWTRSVTKVREENATPPNGPATPTPVSDGKSVFVLYPDVGVRCYSSSGEEKWKVDLQPFRSMHGIGSSLMTVDGLVIVVADQLADSYMAAYSAETGKQVWKSDRLDGVTNAPISVPIVWHDRVFVCEALGEPIPFSLMASADKNKDGKISLEEVKSNVPMTRLVQRIDKGWGNHTGVIGPAEWDKAWATMLNKGGLVALQLGGSGDVTKSNIRWTNGKGMPSISSPVIYDDLIYVVRDGGILTTFEATSGKLVKQARLEGHGRQYYASPIAADGKIFLIDTEGGLSVVKAGRDWKTLATSELGEACWATPAVSDGRLYVRTDKSIYCFGT